MRSVEIRQPYVCHDVALPASLHTSPVTTQAPQPRSALVPTANHLWGKTGGERGWLFGRVIDKLEEVSGVQTPNHLAPGSRGSTTLPVLFPGSRAALGPDVLQDPARAFPQNRPSQKTSFPQRRRAPARLLLACCSPQVGSSP